MKKFMAAVGLMCCVSLSYADESIYRGMGNAKGEFPGLKQLQAQGLIGKKPEVSRYDYNDVYKVKKPFQFLGQKVVLVSDEYMSKYVGCCVSEGWGAVFAKTGDLKPLQQYAKKHQCNLGEIDQDTEDYYNFRFKSLPRAQYYELSCRERDLNTEE